MFATFITQIITLSTFLISQSLISPEKVKNFSGVERSHENNGKEANQPITNVKRVSKNRAQTLSSPNPKKTQQETSSKKNDPKNKIQEIKAENAEGCPTLRENADDAECVVKALQKTYAQLTTLQGTFTQEYTYAVYQRTQTSQGKLF